MASDEKTTKKKPIYLLLANVPQLAATCAKLADSIDPEHLYVHKEIRDGQPLPVSDHITVRFGLVRPLSKACISAICSSAESGPVSVTVSGFGIFQTRGKTFPDTGTTHSYDILVCNVAKDSIDGLVAWRTLCDADTQTAADTRPFTPHVTLAYLKPGYGEIYAAQLESPDVKLEIQSLTFREYKDHASETVIPLVSKKEAV